MFSKLIKALAECDLDESTLKALIVTPKERENGDFTLPCFSWSKLWKKSPKDCAEQIISKLQLPTEFDRVENINGYLNFYLNRGFLVKQVLSDIEQDLFYKPEQKTIVIDFSSPNIAKALHVGHFRNTAIGNCIDKLLRFLGHKVIAVNHLGDWGTQFGFVYAGCEIWGKPEATVDALVEVYKKAGIASKEQIEKSDLGTYPDITKMAREYFVRLENKDPEAFAFWQWCLDISLDYLKDIYKDLNVNFDFYTGESFYQDHLQDVKQYLESAGILESSDLENLKNTLGVDLGKLGFARVYTEDGRSLYLTRDIATAIYRDKTFHPNQILYVVGAPQTLHFQQLVGILERLSHPASSKIKALTYGHVPGISTRTGGSENFSFKALVDEAQERAFEKIKDNPDADKISKAVGIGSLFFNYLNRTNIKDFHFVWEDALNFTGDSGPYLQYAYARLCGIERNALSQGLVPNLNPELLLDDESYNILALLREFNSVLEKTEREYEPCYLCQFSLNLAKTLSASYKSLRVSGVEKELAESRLALFLSVKKVLKICLELIGIPVIERM